MTAGRVGSENSDLFYNTLAPFHDFAEFVDFSAYEPVPDDWVVMIADVRGSTQAIEEGHYKDVNMVGAASIAAVLNTRGDIDVPFVFGGDGATIVVPGSLRKAAGDALIGLQAISRVTFGLPLRVGAIPVAALRAKGTEVRVRKYELSAGNHLAMFAGGGVELSDSLLKSAEPGSPYLLETPSEVGDPNLEGLSCRWEPLIPQGGRMMTLMVRGAEDDPDGQSGVLEEVVRAISEILGHRLRDSAPASVRSMKFRWPPRGLRLEARATAGRQSFPRRYLGILASSLIQFWCEHFDRRAGAYDAPRYREELRANTDFRKYDGILRMVLDVTEAQAEGISRYLKYEHERGRLIYGVHLADTALMTCLVFSLDESAHLHFIDGSNGGFAKAAQAFKAQLGERR